MRPHINPPIYLPTHQTIHPPIGGEVSTDVKSINRIEISQFIQDESNFYYLGSPPLGGGGWVGEGNPTHVYTSVNLNHLIITGLCFRY